jgi:hypothetical protein
MADRVTSLIDKAVEAAYMHGASDYADLPPHPFHASDLAEIQQIPAVVALYEYVRQLEDDIEAIRG